MKMIYLPGSGDWVLPAAIRLERGPGTTWNVAIDLFNGKTRYIGCNDSAAAERLKNELAAKANGEIK